MVHSVAALVRLRALLVMRSSMGKCLLKDRTLPRAMDSFVGNQHMANVWPAPHDPSSAFEIVLNSLTVLRD